MNQNNNTNYIIGWDYNTLTNITEEFGSSQYEAQTLKDFRDCIIIITARWIWKPAMENLPRTIERKASVIRQSN